MKAAARWLERQRGAQGAQAAQAGRRGCGFAPLRDGGDPSPPRPEQPRGRTAPSPRSAPLGAQRVAPGAAPRGPPRSLRHAATQTEEGGGATVAELHAQLAELREAVRRGAEREGALRAEIAALRQGSSGERLAPQQAPGAPVSPPPQPAPARSPSPRPPLREQAVAGGAGGRPAASAARRPPPPVPPPRLPPLPAARAVGSPESPPASPAPRPRQGASVSGPSSAAAPPAARSPSPAAPPQPTRPRGAVPGSAQQQAPPHAAPQGDRKISQRLRRGWAQVKAACRLPFSRGSAAQQGAPGARLLSPSPPSVVDARSHRSSTPYRTCPGSAQSARSRLCIRGTEPWGDTADCVLRIGPISDRIAQWAPARWALAHREAVCSVACVARRLSVIWRQVHHELLTTQAHVLGLGMQREVNQFVDNFMRALARGRWHGPAAGHLHRRLLMQQCLVREHTLLLADLCHDVVKSLRAAESSYHGLEAVLASGEPA
eukprot:TRINITY_DN27960_c0_g1_i1.p1 TRINITY_DN27960_c0_g1~~TRINITY_DN27960_c0_g1_i1.p1  ORF type:complete len:527 (+),score=91.02 TRINITY_DN27960_c0_g1_i1:117-1583(+)